MTRRIETTANAINKFKAERVTDPEEKEKLAKKLDIIMKEAQILKDKLYPEKNRLYRDDSLPPVSSPKLP